MWTGQDVERMLEAGILEPEEPFELLGGELIAMPSKGRQHEEVKTALNTWLVEHRTPEMMIAPESVLRLGPNDEPQPDFFVYPRSMKVHDVRGDTVLLVIEVSDSRLGYDKKVKAPRYAKFGVREYWVINARNRLTTIYREPRPDKERYTSVTRHEAEEVITPLLAPSLAVRLAKLSSGGD
jgi:Uma2 family endonuclease